MPELCTSSGTALLIYVGPEFPHDLHEDADIAAQADHAKSFADPMCCGLRRGRERSGSHAVSAACGREIDHGLKQPRVIELRGNAHGNGEIVVTYPGNVDTGHRNDGLEIFKRLCALQLNDDRGLFVGLGQELRTRGPIEIVGDAKSNTALSLRRVFELTHDLLGLLPGFNARDHDAARAQIENARERREVQIGHASHGYNSAAATGSDHLFKEVDIAAAMLHVVDDEVQAAGIEHGPNAWRKEFEQQLSQQ